MADRRSALWIGGLGALGITCLAVAIWLGVWAAQLFHESDAFYRGSDGSIEYSDEVYRYYDTISLNSYAMQSLLTPLLTGAVLAGLAALAVLALRRERLDGKRL